MSRDNNPISCVFKNNGNALLAETFRKNVCAEVLYGFYNDAEKQEFAKMQLSEGLAGFGRLVNGVNGLVTMLNLAQPPSISDFLDGFEEGFDSVRGQTRSDTNTIEDIRQAKKVLKKGVFGSQTFGTDIQSFTMWLDKVTSKCQKGGDFEQGAGNDECTLNIDGNPKVFNLWVNRCHWGMQKYSPLRYDSVKANKVAHACYKVASAGFKLQPNFLNNEFMRGVGVVGEFMGFGLGLANFAMDMVKIDSAEKRKNLITAGANGCKYMFSNGETGLFGCNRNVESGRSTPLSCWLSTSVVDSIRIGISNDDVKEADLTASPVYAFKGIYFQKDDSIDDAIGSSISKMLRNYFTKNFNRISNVGTSDSVVVGVSVRLVTNLAEECQVRLIDKPNNINIGIVYKKNSFNQGGWHQGGFAPNQLFELDESRGGGKELTKITQILTKMNPIQNKPTQAEKILEIIGGYNCMTESGGWTTDHLIARLVHNNTWSFARKEECISDLSVNNCILKELLDATLSGVEVANMVGGTGNSFCGDMD